MQPPASRAGMRRQNRLSARVIRVQDAAVKPPQERPAALHGRGAASKGPIAGSAGEALMRHAALGALSSFRRASGTALPASVAAPRQRHLPDMQATTDEARAAKLPLRRSQRLKRNSLRQFTLRRKTGRADCNTPALSRHV
eukprot:365241-Chlamydomonas_euryale.AAC.7